MKKVSMVCLFVILSWAHSGPLYALQAPILIDAGVDSAAGTIHLFLAENEPDADSVILLYRVDEGDFIRHTTFTAGGYVYFSYKEKYLYGEQLMFAAIFIGDNTTFSDTSNILTVATPVLDSLARPPLLSGVRYIDSSGYACLSFKDSCNYEKSFIIFRRTIPGDFTIIRSIDIDGDSARSFRDRIFNDSTVQPFAWYEYLITMTTVKNETLYSRDSLIYTDFRHADGNTYGFDLCKVYSMNISDIYGSWTEIIGDSLFTVQKINSKNYVVILDISDETAPVYDTVFPFDQTPPRLGGTVIEPLCRLNITSNRKKNLQFLLAGNFCFTIETGKIHQYSVDGRTHLGEISDSINNYFLGALPDSAMAVISNGYQVRRIRYSGSGVMKVLDTMSIDLRSLYREVDYTGSYKNKFYFRHSSLGGQRYDFIDYSIPDNPLHYSSGAERPSSFFATQPLDSVSFLTVSSKSDGIQIHTYDNRSGYPSFRNCWSGSISTIGNQTIEDVTVDTAKKRLIAVTNHEIAIFKYFNDIVGVTHFAAARRNPSGTMRVDMRADGIVFRLVAPTAGSTVLSCFDMLGRTGFTLRGTTGASNVVLRIPGKSIRAGTYIYRIGEKGREGTGRFMTVK